VKNQTGCGKEIGYRKSKEEEIGPACGNIRQEKMLRTYQLKNDDNLSFVGNTKRRSGLKSASSAESSRSDFHKGLWKDCANVQNFL
jgi:hypothetical protein